MLLSPSIHAHTHTSFLSSLQNISIKQNPKSSPRILQRVKEKGWKGKGERERVKGKGWKRKGERERVKEKGWKRKGERERVKETGWKRKGDRERVLSAL